MIKDPLEAWHITAEDWDHHRHYDKWLLAYEEAFENTDSEWGPWTIVEATDRRHTRLKIAETIVKAIEKRLNISTEYLMEETVVELQPDIEEDEADEVEGEVEDTAVPEEANSIPDLPTQQEG